MAKVKMEKIWNVLGRVAMILLILMGGVNILIGITLLISRRVYFNSTEGLLAVYMIGFGALVVFHILQQEYSYKRKVNLYEKNIEILKEEIREKNKKINS